MTRGEMLPSHCVLMIHVERRGGMGDHRVGLSWRSSSGSMTWDISAMVDASGRTCLFRGRKLWAVVNSVEAVVVVHTGGTMISDWGGCSGGPQAGGVHGR